jgi:ABC-type uncharacterized transport system permease subunit
MNNSNLKPSAPNWKMIAGVIVGSLVGIWVITRVLSALAGLIKLGIIIAVIAVVASFVLKLVNKPKK